MLNYEESRKEFKKYIANFDVKNEEIAMKISHSYHVADLAGKLAKRLELPKEEVELAKIIGLLHDIGRFTQYEKTHTYDDYHTNIDHAKLAILYLFEEGHIKEYVAEENYYSIIKTAIINHNRLAIEDGLTKKENFFAKFIRDIDKIDIFRAIATTYDLSYKEEPEKEVKQDFYAHGLVNMYHNKTESDKVLSYIAYAFEINFKESFELLEDSDNLELLFSVVEVGKDYIEEFEKIKKEVRDFIKERVTPNVR